MVRVQGDAKFCKNVADAYLQTAIHCNELDKKASTSTMLFASEAFFAIPAATNVAFACELYLKSIGMQIKSQGAMYGHPLITLYNDLTDDQKQELEKIFAKYCPYSTVTLESTLKHHADTFKYWRYIYEHTNDPDLSRHDVYIDNLLSAAQALKEYADMPLDTKSKENT